MKTAVVLLASLIGSPVAVVLAHPYIDDEKLYSKLNDSMQKSAEEGKATEGKKLRKQMDRSKCRAALVPVPAIAQPPDKLYSTAAPGVAVISSAWKSEDGKTWEVGDPATAWVLTADGLLVTNHHVFEGKHDEEVFGVMLRDGTFHLVEEIMAADRATDVAIFRIRAKGLHALPLAPIDDPVGERIFVVSHPNRQFYTFTQGDITRYTLQHDEQDDEGIRFMSISADYARGSSGGPVLNSFGAVVGMVCSTQTTYYGEKGKDLDDDVQMVVKFCVPGESIRALLSSGVPAPEVLPEAPRAEIVPRPEVIKEDDDGAKAGTGP